MSQDGPSNEMMDNNGGSDEEILDVENKDKEVETVQEKNTPVTQAIEELKAAAAAAKQHSNSTAAQVPTVASQSPPESQNRAKKAQKTKGRVKINIPFSENTEDQIFTQDQKKKQKHQPEPVVVYEDDDDDIDDDIAEDEEPSKVIAAVSGLLHGIASFICKVCFFFYGCTCKSIQAIWKLMCLVVPLLIGIPLYCVLVYLSAEYLVNRIETGQHADMNCRLSYVLRCHAFTLLPILMGVVVSSIRSAEFHKEFMHETLQHSVLFILNTIIMAAHCNNDQIHCIGCLVIAYLIYSLLYWMSLSYGSKKLQSTLRSPIIVTNVSLMLYNTIIISGQYFGYFLPEGTMEDESMESAGAYWQFSMCDMAERVFCGDMHRPMTGFGYSGYHAVDVGTQTDALQDTSSYSWWYFLFPTGILSLFYQNQHIIF